VVTRLIKNSFAGNTETLPDYILNDARYDYLGRIDYIKLTDKLLRELAAYGKITDRKSWIENQKKYLSDHKFLTNSARLLRSIPVEDQIAALEDLLNNPISEIKST
jgi:hypothetical protein